MAFSNNMTALVNKIEQRLGTAPLTLPDHLQKSEWPNKVIIPMTISTWSRFFPNKIKYHIDGSHPMKNGWYILDEDMFDGVKILGVQNINWANFNANGYGGSYGYYDTYSYGLGVEDMANIIGGTNIASLYNNNLYPTFEPPNRFRLETMYGRLATVNAFDVYVLVEHNPTLLSISPTQMETFEKLAQADVATYLHQELKYFDNLETVFANVNMRLDELQEKANQREEIMNYINESYVSAANKNQPYILCI